MHHHTAPNGVQYLQFEQIPPARVKHGVMTRHGGVSLPPYDSLNFAWRSVGDQEAHVLENNRRAHAALHLDVDRIVDRYIAHTARIWQVDESHLGQEAPFADGYVTRTPDLSLVMTFADCQPILAYDPVAHVLGIAHAGWRGTVAGVAYALIVAMEQMGSEPTNIQAALGPAIGVCCYEVGEDVVFEAETWPGGGAWLQAGPRGRPHFDLSTANTDILRRAGVQQVEQSDLCSACRTDLFYSYRAERPVTGRFALIAALSSYPST